MFRSFSHRYISLLYEIYPQSETPLLTQIAHLDCNKIPVQLLTDSLIFWDFRDDTAIFRVWDYRANYSTCFAADINLRKFNLKVLSVFSKMLKLVLTDSLGRYSPPRQPSSFSLKKEYPSGPSHLYHPILPTTFLTTIQLIYFRSSQFHSRMALLTLTSLVGGQSLPGTLNLGNSFI